MTPKICLRVLLLLAIVLPPVLQTKTYVSTHTSSARTSHLTPPHAVSPLPEPIVEDGTHGDDWQCLTLAKKGIANGTSEGIRYLIEQSLWIDSAVKVCVRRIEQVSLICENHNHPTMGTALSALFILATFSAAAWITLVYFRNAKNRSMEWYKAGVGAVKRTRKVATGNKNRR